MLPARRRRYKILSGTCSAGALAGEWLPTEGYQLIGFPNFASGSTFFSHSSPNQLEMASTVAVMMG